jgi:uncharacterized protein YmfQ (DUF2313 family)
MATPDKYFKLLARLMFACNSWMGPNLQTILSVIAYELYEVDRYTNILLDETNPLYSTIAGGLLTDHEADLGLPDECTALGLTEADRQRIAYAKFAKPWSMSKSGIEEIIYDFGFSEDPEDWVLVEVIEASSPAVCAQAVCGTAIVGVGDVYFTVNITIKESAPQAVKDTLACTLKTVLKPTTVININFTDEIKDGKSWTRDLTWDIDEEDPPRTYSFDSTLIRFDATTKPE